MHDIDREKWNKKKKIYEKRNLDIEISTAGGEKTGDRVEI